MNQPARATAAILVFVAGLVLIGGVTYYIATAPETQPPPAVQTTQPTTTTAPATQAVVQGPPRTYGEVLKAAYPQLATTQPLGVPLDTFSEGAHVVLTDPIYVCSRLDLWITRGDAEPAEKALATAVEDQTHLTRDPVLFVHWSPDDRGKWRPRIVTTRGGEGGGEGGGFELISPTARTPLPGKHPYLWHRALSWNDMIIVPTASGISVLTPGEMIDEIHHAFPMPADAKDPPAEPQVTFDAKGIIAWMPWDTGKSGSTAAVRFADGKFTPLGAEQGWPHKLVHVVPLLDGSVLQVFRDEQGKLQPRLELLNRGDVDEKAVTALVDQLSDPDPEKRQQAFNELTRYGPGVWPLLEKLAEDQPPEASIRLRQLLANKIQPTMGGLTLVDGDIETAARLPDGGVVFFAPQGVSFPRENAEPQVVKPAWISMRAGKHVEVLPEQLLKDAAPPTHQIYAFNDEWILSDAETGPQRLMFNHMQRVLREDEKAFSRLYAVDRRGRWLFRKLDPQSRETLILDPTFPDPMPRLPIWLMSIYQGSVGWDENNWPVIKSGGAWALREKGWEPLDEAKQQKMLTDPPPRDTSPHGLATQPLLVDSDGNRYFDGATILHVVSKDNKHTVWPLPFSARGRLGGTLMRDKGGTLFLVNQPGRILRIRRTPDGDEPYKLDATFTHRVPDGPNIARIWLDGADRLCIAYDGNKLAICFPEGRIPPHIAMMIPANELR